MTAPEVGEFDPGQHLTVRDIAVDKVENPQCLSVRIKQSKTDPFRQGVSIYLGRMDTPLCPVLLGSTWQRGRPVVPVARNPTSDTPAVGRLSAEGVVTGRPRSWTVCRS